MTLLPRPSALILTAAATTTPAHSSTAYEGELQDIHFMSNGVVLVSTTGSRTTARLRFGCRPLCLRLDHAAGRSQLAGLIAAEAADRLVVIRGTGDCTAYADSETIEYFYIVD